MSRRNLILQLGHLRRRWHQCMQPPHCSSELRHHGLLLRPGDGQLSLFHFKLVCQPLLAPLLHTELVEQVRATLLGGLLLQQNRLQQLNLALLLTRCEQPLCRRCCGRRSR